MMLALLLACPPRFSGAQVDTAFDSACFPTTATDGTPAYDANVPVDITPTLLFDGVCGGAPDWWIELVDADDDIVYYEAEWHRDGNLPALVLLDMADDLPPQTTVRVRANPSPTNYLYYYPSESFDSSFTTGEGSLQPLEGTLSAEITDATWYFDGARATVSMVVHAAHDPNGLSWIHLHTDDADRYFRPGDGDLVEPDLSWFETPEPTELCVEVSQIDGGGVESAPISACAAPEIIEPQQSTQGCSSRAGAASLGLGLAALFLVRRSRR